MTPRSIDVLCGIRPNYRQTPAPPVDRRQHWSHQSHPPPRSIEASLLAHETHSQCPQGYEIRIGSEISIRTILNERVSCFTLGKPNTSFLHHEHVNDTPQRGHIDHLPFFTHHPDHHPSLAQTSRGRTLVIRSHPDPNQIPFGKARRFTRYV